jgi:tRNA(fMet)-specific endonuclease VapC
MILDTDILSALATGRCPAMMYHKTEGASALYSTAVNWAEICYGISRLSAEGGARLRARYEERVLPFLQFLDFDVGSAEVYGRLRAELEQHGLPLSDADLMIASIALRHDLLLVTGNTRHFLRVPGLRLENWLEG